MTIEELYIQTLNTVYVILSYDIPCCGRVVISDGCFSCSVQILLMNYFSMVFLLYVINLIGTNSFLGFLCGAGGPVGG